MHGADRELVIRLSKFLVVGGTGIVVNNVALYTGYQLFRMPLAVASACAVTLAMLNNFLLNDRWTFSRSTLSFDRFIRFCLSSMGGLAIASFALWVLVTHFEVHYLAANLLGIGLGAATNYIVSVRWTWAGRGDR
jgi:putative flippase GtrA